MRVIIIDGIKIDYIGYDLVFERYFDWALKKDRARVRYMDYDEYAEEEKNLVFWNGTD